MRWLRNRERPKIACSGCGIGLQSRDQAAAGYIPTLKQLEDLEKRAEEALAASRAALLKKKRLTSPLPPPGNEENIEADEGDVAVALRSGLDLRTGTFGGHGVVCQRCFQAKHYGRLVPLTLPSDAFAPYLEALHSSGAVVVHVVDVFDFHSTAAAFTSLQDLAKDHATTSPRPIDVVLVINKVDLLPTDANHRRIEEWARREVGKLGLLPKKDDDDDEGGGGRGGRRGSKKGGGRGGMEVITSSSSAGGGGGGGGKPPMPNLAAVHIVSSSKQYGIRDLVATIKELKGSRDVYVVGAPNVGKSTLINALLGEVWNLKPAAGPSLPSGSKQHPNQQQRLTRTLFLDELPPGYTLGDVFTGDTGELDARIRQRDAGTSGGGTEGDTGTSGGAVYDPTAHLKRRGVLGSPLSPREAALLDGVLEEHRAKKDKYKAIQSWKDGSGGGSATGGEGETKTTGVPPSSSPLSSSSSSSSRHPVDVSSPHFDVSSSIRSLTSSVVPVSDPTTVTIPVSPSPATPSSSSEGGGTVSSTAPWMTTALARRGAAGTTGTTAALPFTTSALPGTTLGVIGAPLDPHGHTYIYDTPGIITDPWKQRLLEQLVSVGGGTPPPATGPLDESPNAPKKAPGLRPLLVPDKRTSYPIIRLRPGRSLFIGGLARLDWRHPDPSVGVLLHVSTRLPLHTTMTHKADDLFKKHGLGVGEEDGTGGGDSASGRGYARGGHHLLHPAWGPLIPSPPVHLITHIPDHVKKAMTEAGVSMETYLGGGAGRGHVSGDRGGVEAMEVEVVGGAPHPHDDDDDEEWGKDGLDGTILDPRNDKDGGRGDKKSGGGVLQQALWRYGGGAAGTEARRRRRVRKALFDVALPGIGWVSVTPIEIEGMYGWWRSVSRGSLVVSTCQGLTPSIRPPLLPHETSGTRPQDWLE